MNPQLSKKSARRLITVSILFEQMTGDDHLATRLGLNKVQAISFKSVSKSRQILEEPSMYELSVVRPEDKWCKHVFFFKNLTWFWVGLQCNGRSSNVTFAHVRSHLTKLKVDIEFTILIIDSVLTWMQTYHLLSVFLCKKKFYRCSHCEVLFLSSGTKSFMKSNMKFLARVILRNIFRN